MNDPIDQISDRSRNDQDQTNLLNTFRFLFKEIEDKCCNDNKSDDDKIYSFTFQYTESSSGIFSISDIKETFDDSIIKMTI